MQDKGKTVYKKSFKKRYRTIEVLYKKILQEEDMQDKGGTVHRGPTRSGVGQGSPSEGLCVGGPWEWTGLGCCEELTHTSNNTGPPLGLLSHYARQEGAVMEGVGERKIWEG
ncbi:hypothetical protein Pcinc_039199 [Petrolisthes cinctipes]|uniref:Uncharacterized protein n=1 Tax=Petrolisthes cinctipes TaxID=88211 RepID=A0AAE1EM56_PETCI|nr:hypothetical protein Pcinc_039199 [Petrolisthes cinctipes]